LLTAGTQEGFTMTRMLVVEDDPAWRALYRMTFKDRFEVYEAADGHDGLSKYEAVHPDVILLDLKMPRMDGADFVRQLRGRGEVPPIVMCSGVTDPSEAPRVPGVVRMAAKTADLRDVWTALRDALPAATPSPGELPVTDSWRD
jgi:CheY-like chemotaxis protein